MTGPLQSTKSGTKPKKEYNATVKKLQARAEQQQFLLQRTHDLIHEQHELHTVLADGICQQKVLYKVIMPLHQQWMQQQGAPDSTSWLHGCAAWDCEGVHWGSLVPLVSSCNTMLAAMLKATPQQLQEVLSLTQPELINIHSAFCKELSMLLELMSPQRYQGRTTLGQHTASMHHTGTQTKEQPDGSSKGGMPGAPSQQQQHQQQQPRGAAECAAVASALEAEVQAIATSRKQAEARLVELIEESCVLGSLLVLHRPDLLMNMCSTNFVTGQTTVAPLGHFICAAERLGLSGIQVQHLRLMLQQYNRGMQEQLQCGLDLLKLSSDSVGVQAAAVTATASSSGNRLTPDSSRLPPSDGQHAGCELPRRGPEAAAVPAAAALATAHNAYDRGAGSGGGLRKESSSSGGGSSSRGSGSGQQERQQAQQGEAAAEADHDAGLAEKLQKHVAERMELMQLMGFWVANTLSPVQFAKLMVYSWPYYPLCSALAEGAAILPIADEVDEEVQEFTKRRREGMQAELEWLVKHTHQLIDLN